MTKHPSYGIFGHDESEFTGWLLMLSPTPVCGGSRFTQVHGRSACCQLHAVRDCLKHAAGDEMSAEDRITCILAVEYLQAGKGTEATPTYTLSPNHGLEIEVEN